MLPTRAAVEEGEFLPRGSGRGLKWKRQPSVHHQAGAVSGAVIWDNLTAISSILSSDLQPDRYERREIDRFH
jgi:hypothetical protein